MSGKKSDLNFICCVKVRRLLAGLVFLFFVSTVWGDTDIQRMELSEELAIYILSVYPGYQERSIDEWRPIEARVQRLLDSGADPDLYVHKARSTPLGATIGPAVQTPLFNIVAPLSRSLDKPHYRNVYPIESAIRAKNLSAIEYLVKRGVSLNSIPCCQELEKMPFLYRAAAENDFEFVNFLLDQGADIDIKFRHSSSLRSSIKGKRFEMAKLLLERGAGDGCFPLLHDAILSDAPLDILQSLIETGFGPNSLDPQGLFKQTALEFSRKLNNENATNFLEQYN